MRTYDDITVGDILNGNAPAEMCEVFELRATVNMRSVALDRLLPKLSDLSNDGNEVVDAIGLQMYRWLKSCMRKQGNKSGFLSVPRRICQGHQIRQWIGDEAADSLQAAVGGRTLDLRERKMATRTYRDDEILAAHTYGERTVVTASRYNLDVRQVRRVRRERAGLWGVVLAAEWYRSEL